MDADWQAEAGEVGRIVSTGLGTFCEALVQVTSHQQLQDVCLDLLSDMVPSRGCGIYIFGNRGSQPPLTAARGVSDRFLSAYERAGREADLVLGAVIRRRQPVSSRHLMSEDKWVRSPLYTEVLALHDMRVVLEAPILYRGQVVGTLNFSDRDPQALSSPLEYALLGSIGNVVGLAVGSISEREGLVSERDQLLEAFELSDQPMVIRDTGTGTSRTNKAAAQLLRELDPEQPEVFLEELMAEARTNDGICQVYRSEVEVSGKPGHLILRNFPGGTGNADIMVSTLQLSRQQAAAGQLPRELALVLSKREAEVAAQAVLGLGDEEIGRQLFLSPYTVKQHLKSTYRKLGVRSRVELTRLALSGGDQNAR